jgi:anti-sigma-K factor RskA
MAGVQVSAVYLRRDGLTVVDFKDMPPTQPSQVYELWLITADGRALPAGVFVPDSNGSKLVLITQDLKGASELAVTIEPGPNGSPLPTQQPQLKGAIA